jgi:hypothetical protein
MRIPAIISERASENRRGTSSLIVRGQLGAIHYQNGRVYFPRFQLQP